MGAEGVRPQLRAYPPRLWSLARNASIPVGYMVSGRIRTMNLLVLHF